MKISTDVTHLSKYKKYIETKKYVREYFDSNGYLEIDLPVLSPALIPESYLEVFETELAYGGVKEKMYLTPSPELFLKRLLAYGINQDCYYLGKAFRNADPHAILHSPEFTMLEFYRLNASYLSIADEVLRMMQYVAGKLYHSNTFVYQGKTISLTDWEKFTVAQAFEQFAHISGAELFDHAFFLDKAQKKGYKTDGFSYEDVWSQIYVQEIEPFLGKQGKPTLIYDYPKEFAALAKINPDGKTAQRFEFYIEGVELGDCYTELTDWKEQKERFEISQREREETHKIIHPVDKGFIEALQYGLSDCAGIAIGFERLAMIFADTASISEAKLIDII